MKNERQAKILSLIKEKNIETQEELTSLLLQAGYKVTQATVSRDIKELKIIKIAGEKGGYKYASASTDRSGVRAKYKKIIEETVLSASYAENLVVIKTFSGMAQAAGAAIDAIAFSEVLGCIAGDDTLIAVANGEQAACAMTAKINDMLHH
ncbi:MAG: arginine repressor [Clostridiales bacterium]|nr:arginine repressor [Clostridiales bacterium]